MENVAINAKKKINMEKYFSQVKIVTPNNISKIFNVSVRSVVTSSEIVNNFLLISGKIVANVVYLTDENKVENTETTLDFVEKQKINFFLSEIFACDTLEVQSVSFSTSEVVCSVVHDTVVNGVYRYMLGDATKTEPELVLKKKTINCLNFILSNSENFVVAEEVESNLKNIKILNIDTSVMLVNAVSAVEKIVIDGKIKINALYNDENGLGEIVKEFEFKQELAMKNAMPGMVCDVDLKFLNTAITEQVGEDKSKLAFVIDLFVKANVYENVNIETFEDLFSLKNEIVPTFDLIEYEEDGGFEFDNDTVLTQFDISANGDFDDIVGVFQPKVNVVQIEDLGEKVLILANINAVAIYKTANSLSKMDLCYETRFETTKDITKKISEVQVDATVSAYKVKAGKDLESAFLLEYKFCYKKDYCENFVKSFEIKKEKEISDDAVLVYVAKENQTVFEVAKILNVAPEIIEKQNEVEDVFESGQKVYVYRPLNLV